MLVPLPFSTSSLTEATGAGTGGDFFGTPKEKRGLGDGFGASGVGVGIFGEGTATDNKNTKTI